MSSADDNRTFRLEKLSLANYRGFKQLDLEFEPDITVLIGTNGTGKSSLLEALIKSLKPLLHNLIPEIPDEDKLPSLHDVHKGTPSSSDGHAVTYGMHWDNSMTIQSIFHLNLENHPFFISSSLPSVTPHREKNGSMGWGSNGWPTLRTANTKDELAGSPAGEQDVSELREKVQLTGPNYPIAVYFGLMRSLQGEEPQNLESDELIQAYAGALDSRRGVTARGLSTWFHTQNQKGIISQEGSRRKAWESLLKAVKLLVPGFASLESSGIDLKVSKDEVPLFMSQISAGERVLLAIVLDLARRLAIANPESEDPLSEGRGIVLIDEIELHLHPQWQRTVLKNLTETFRNCQFVVTTHSPVVLGEVEARCVRYLYREDDKVQVYTPAAALGMDANRILEEDMGTPVRNKEAAEELKKLFDLIDKDELQKASKRIEELEAKWGGNEPELTRARALITFLEDD